MKVDMTHNQKDSALLCLYAAKKENNVNQKNEMIDQAIKYIEEIEEL